MALRFLPVNLNALLVELDDLPHTLALLEALQRTPLPGIDELVPAARTILVRFRPARVSAAALAGAIAGLAAQLGAGGPASGSQTLLRIPVRYDGEDLAEVAALLGTTPAEVVRRHGSADYSVAFTGFAPGFAFLSGGDPGFDVPRRKTPRTRIPAGAVALAGRFSGVYPQASPGGWQIIGTTPLAMWDLARDPPALLQPGQRVRFVDIETLPPAELQALLDAAAAPPMSSAAPQPSDVDRAASSLEVITAGAQSLLQDLGRPGRAAQGVSASGALDRAACIAANRLVGNAAGDACIESAGGGLALRSRGDTVVAVCGADALLRIRGADGSHWPAPRYRALALADGDVLTIGEPRAGTRSYVALRGGFAVAPVLGSRATDTLARLGPPPLAAGDVLAVREADPRHAVALHEEPVADLPTTAAEVVLDVVPGPRTDWFSADALALLAAQRWLVSPQSNRVGLRLEGEQPLQRAILGELPSEGTVRGALQVPASGQPVLFLADHPLTGGYPVIAAVAPHHLDRAGQVPIGATLRFRPIAGFAAITPLPEIDP